MMPTGPASA
jgi:PAS domain S-box-containing protein